MKQLTGPMAFVQICFVYFVQYFHPLESWPLADYEWIRSVCALILLKP